MSQLLGLAILLLESGRGSEAAWNSVRSLSYKRDKA
jgi:hypothetical protein